MHTHILLFGSKFHIILAMCVQMLDIYIYRKYRIFLIFSKLSPYFPTLNEVPVGIKNYYYYYSRVRHSVH